MQKKKKKKNKEKETTCILIMKIDLQYIAEQVCMHLLSHNDFKVSTCTRGDPEIMGLLSKYFIETCIIKWNAMTIWILFFKYAPLF